MSEPMDRVFDRIILVDTKAKIAQAFVNLEYEIRSKNGTHTNGVLSDFVEEKASQTKKALNDFVDSQVERIMSFLKE